MTQAGDPVAGRSVTGRALALLGAFDVDHPRLTLTELSGRTGLPLATVHRLAKELEQWRALDRDEQGRYGVGFRLWEMGLLAPVHSRLREAALPFLLRAHQQTGETIQFAACDGLEAVYVERLTTSESVPKSNRVGGRLPLHATGVGKALLAHQGPAFAEALLQTPLHRWTRWTLTDRGALRRELAQIRQQGYATSRQEFHPGSCSIAVPVTVAEEARAAVGIVVYDLRDDLAQYLPPLQAAARAIATRMENTTGNPFPSLTPEST